MAHIETLLAHAGCEPDPTTGAIVSPIHLATTFERDPEGTFERGYFYSRADNPTRRALEETLAAVEGGAGCAAFASGMAAASAILHALSPGDHIILADDAYWGVRKAVQTLFSNWGLLYTEVDLTDLDTLETAIEPRTKLVWAETPSNPMLKITDLAAVAERAHARGALLVVDGTFATPLLQHPLEQGADLVMHSVTKYLSGHSDVLGGAVIGKGVDGFFRRVRAVQTDTGPVMDPFSAWLTLRGMRSLAARMRIQCDNAMAVARFLEGHPRVSRVYYPGLESHPGHEVARRQMRGFGAMLSFEIAGAGREEGLAVAARTQVFRRATSLGGTESLIEHRASIEAQPTRTPESLIRLSIGLEHADDLVTDLSRALGE
ncbi:MAG TPA: aminotransferase class V-fold PLP-dependent enzyme [Rhodothermales bacterium]|nr:aminotransferase class V-fold PLP-dependent enzyme [Rhodothermales bacterium]